MSKARWAHAALFALALPACAGAAGSTQHPVAHARPAGQAAQPGSWNHAEAKVDYVKHVGPRGQAAQPYAWLDSKPAYPADQQRLAQDGPSYLGGRAAQPGSWTPSTRTSWTLAKGEALKAKE